MADNDKCDNNCHWHLESEYIKGDLLEIKSDVKALLSEMSDMRMSILNNKWISKLLWIAIGLGLLGSGSEVIGIVGKFI